MLQATVLLALALSALAAPSDDLVTNLPGAPSGGFKFKQYSGYLSVRSAHYHYFFAECQANPASAPLIMWLNGGPGCSSMEGAFQELGPFSIGPDLKLTPNDWSWNRVANVLFLESPAGVGWSWSEESNPSYNDNRTANENYDALVAWFAKFPEYATNDLYLAGESYAGHYVPQLANIILQATKNNPKKAPQSNLKGFAVGNPSTDQGYDFGRGFLNQYLKMHAMIPLNADNNVEQAGGWYDVYNILGDVCSSRGSNLLEHVRFKHPLIDRVKLSKRYVENRYSCSDNYTWTWSNMKATKDALHVKSSIKWSVCGGPFKYTGGPSSVLNIWKKFVTLPQYKLLVYSGDEDTVIPFIGTQTWILDLKLPVSAEWKAWTYNRGAGPQVGGYTMQFNGGAQFNFTTVKGAGHMVPWTQPAQAFTMISNFLKH